MIKEFKEIAILEKSGETCTEDFEIENPKKRVVSIRETLNSDGSKTDECEVQICGNGLNSGEVNVVGTPEEIKERLGGRWLEVTEFPPVLDKKPQGSKTFFNVHMISPNVEEDTENENTKSIIAVSIPTMNRNSSYTQKRKYNVDKSVEEIKSFLEVSSIKKVLFLTANPEDTIRLRLDKETRIVKMDLNPQLIEMILNFILNQQLQFQIVQKQSRKYNLISFTFQGMELVMEL